LASCDTFVCLRESSALHVLRHRISMCKRDVAFLFCRTGSRSIALPPKTWHSKLSGGLLSAACLQTSITIWSSEDLLQLMTPINTTGTSPNGHTTRCATPNQTVRHTCYYKYAWQPISKNCRDRKLLAACGESKYSNHAVIETQNACT